MSRGIIVVEGVDGAGKSTFVQKLAERFEAHVVHTGPPQTNWQYQEHVTDMCNALAVSPWIIYDRLHLSSYVYGEVYGTGPRLDRNEWQTLEGMIRTFGMGGLVVLADPSWEWVQKVAAERAEAGETDEQWESRIAEVFQTFTGAARATNLPLVRIDLVQPSAMPCLVEALKVHGPQWLEREHALVARDDRKGNA